MKMLKHIVVIKFHERVDGGQIAELEKMFASLPDQIPEIKEFIFGADILKTPRSYDYAVVSLFSDIEALVRYQQHPAHISVVEFLRPLASGIIVVDFEV